MKGIKGNNSVIAWTFTIHGNQEEQKGNPIPYHRTTQRGKFSPNHKRYERWKQFVAEEFVRQVPIDYWKLPFFEEVKKNIICGKKPIGNINYARMDMFIKWGNNAHADPDNIFKGIADALFQNDKNVAGSFDFDVKPMGKGSVEIQIKIII